MSMFQHRHYEAIAEIMADINRSIHLGEISAAESFGVVDIAIRNMFAEDNPKFNRERYIKACGWV
jgi:predicted dinucleotide-utilizing enzyme